jgi:hypothetical protein
MDLAALTSRHCIRMILMISRESRTNVICFCFRRHSCLEIIWDTSLGSHADLPFEEPAPGKIREHSQALADWDDVTKLTEAQLEQDGSAGPRARRGRAEEKRHWLLGRRPIRGSHDRCAAGEAERMSHASTSSSKAGTSERPSRRASPGIVYDSHVGTRGARAERQASTLGPFPVAHFGLPLSLFCSYIYEFSTISLASKTSVRCEIL